MAPPERGTAGWPGLISQRRLLVARSLSRHGELQGTGGEGGRIHTRHTQRPWICLGFRRSRALRSSTTALRHYGHKEQMSRGFRDMRAQGLSPPCRDQPRAG